MSAPPAIRSRELQAEVWLPLLQETLAREGRLILPLRGNSMRPTLPQECEIEVVPLASPPRLGEVTVFAAGDALVAHRVVRRSQGFILTQGDNRRAPDARMRPEQVLGRLAAARVGGRQIWPRRGEKAWALLWLARSQTLAAVRLPVRLLRGWVAR